MKVNNLLAELRFNPRSPPDLCRKTIIVIFGMHRSGTSAVAGMLQEHSIELGPVSERNRFNPRGNREIRALNRLHDRVLKRSGGSWWKPPASTLLQTGDFRTRNRILRSIPGQIIGTKDPRMLLVPELWRDLDLKPIGVIRNPVAVRGSLERRARERDERGQRSGIPDPPLSTREFEGLWVTYNRALLAEHRRRPFPVINFDRNSELDAQIRSALAAHGLKPSGASHFFERELITQRTDEWRSQVATREALDLWDALEALAVP